MLYDVVGSLADAVGPALANPDLIPLILPPLLDKYAATGDDDTHLFSLLECLTSVATSLGPTFLPYAPPVWERALSLCGKTIAQWQGFCTGTVPEAPDKDFLIVSLDLLSGMVQGLGSAVEPLVQASQPPLWRVVGACMQDPSHEVRQSAYALLGDMAISVFSHIQPHLSDLMPELIGQVDPNSEFVSVCNNAAWAGGEISLQFGEGMTPYVSPLLERLIPLLGEGIQRTLSENAAIAIGRLGLSCPSLVAPSLDVIGERWCKALRIVSDNNEKESAFRGFCAMIQANPSGLSPIFPYFVDAVVQWQTPTPELNDMFSKIICGFKDFMGTNWDTYVVHFPQPIRQLLQERYGV
ncbi:armadillo-type protein [Piptocephalis cylindrospora]|uniref:Armadillo-type protein n=1 Tax=Piptocephalis cylindrospora TaxID=1907219 RepID=A0A4V1IXJ8_9FUNG|nr:armadillo-type protein [Piptocephalis cylindrospora]|eukprot:RKP11309.1 armadillo-type protein [Piptocephalis cylindrospora]